MVHDTPSESSWRPTPFGGLYLCLQRIGKCRKEVFPHVEQRECFRHMMQNYVRGFPGGAEHMYPAARAYRKVVHDHHLAIVREKSDVCYWLDTYHSLL
jgi:hypothetical protein